MEENLTQPFETEEASSANTNCVHTNIGSSQIRFEASEHVKSPVAKKPRTDLGNDMYFQEQLRRTELSDNLKHDKSTNCGLISTVNKDGTTTSNKTFSCIVKSAEEVRCQTECFNMNYDNVNKSCLKNLNNKDNANSTIQSQSSHERDHSRMSEDKHIPGETSEKHFFKEKNNMKVENSENVDKSTMNSCTVVKNDMDVYEISEWDENSQPLSPLNESKKVRKDTTVCTSENTVVSSQVKMNSQSRVAYIYSDNYVRICDEMIRVAGRASMVHSLIEAYGLLRFLDVMEPREAMEDELLRFHTADYIQFLKKISEQDDEEKYNEEAELYGLTYDCPVHCGVYEYAVLVAGATVRAAELLLDGSCDMAINWGGGWHHAKRDTASGFCYFNDIVLGILKLREKFERVLYVDLDLHHGDGVEDAFCTTSKVLTVSFHKYLTGFFPGTGSISDVGVSKGRHYTLNIPLLDGIKDTEFFALFNRVMTKVQENFRPEAIVCQCGADGLAGDPMESFNLTPLSLARCVHTLKNWKIPLLILGGGGYNFTNTAKCWALITSVVVGKKLPADIPDHEFFTRYGPDYELGVSAGNRKDNNSREYLGKVYRQTIENINQIQ